jgi:hypothetical protein
MTTLRIPGSVFDDFLDPLSTDMAAAIGLPSPTIRRHGAGCIVTYTDVTAVQAEDVAEHLDGRGATLLGQGAIQGDDEDRRCRDVYRAAINTAARIRLDLADS